MQDQRIPPTVLEDDEIDEAVMSLLLDQRRGLWSVEEIASEMKDRVDAEDGLARLAAAGLVHRLDGFVFATRAAARASDLARA
jgi:hypothetical protein